MIGLAFALLTASSALAEQRRETPDVCGYCGGRPGGCCCARASLQDIIERDDFGAFLDPRAYRMDAHLHEGRLLHQYARQPRASRHRICRGRP